MTVCARRIGNIHAPEATGKFIAATFEQTPPARSMATQHRNFTPMP